MPDPRLFGLALEDEFLASAAWWSPGQAWVGLPSILG